MCFIYESLLYSTSVQLLFSPFIQDGIIELSTCFLAIELTTGAFSIKLYVLVAVPGQSRHALSCHGRGLIIHEMPHCAEISLCRDGRYRHHHQYDDCGVHVGAQVGIDILNRVVECVCDIHYSNLAFQRQLHFVVDADLQACHLGTFVQLDCSFWGQMHQLFPCDVLSHVVTLSH